MPQPNLLNAQGKSFTILGHEGTYLFLRRRHQALLFARKDITGSLVKWAGNPATDEIKEMKVKFYSVTGKYDYIRRAADDDYPAYPKNFAAAAGVVFSHLPDNQNIVDLALAEDEQLDALLAGQIQGHAEEINNDLLDMDQAQQQIDQFLVDGSAAGGNNGQGEDDNEVFQDLNAGFGAASASSLNGGAGENQPITGSNGRHLERAIEKMTRLFSMQMTMNLQSQKTQMMALQRQMDQEDRRRNQNMNQSQLKIQAQKPTEFRAETSYTLHTELEH